MGNSATKEQRPPPQLHAPPGSHRSRHSPPHAVPSRSSENPLPDQSPSPLYGPRRGSRPDFLPTAPTDGSDQASNLEVRRESRQERDARRAERDRVAREKERERSLRDESVDGGYLVTLGVYTGAEDFNKPIVRQLMIERRLAPFFKGLNEHSESWKDHQLVAAVRGEPVPTADDVPVSDNPSIITGERVQPVQGGQDINHLMIPITARSQSYNSDSSSNVSPSQPTSSLPSSPSPLDGGAGSSPFRPRSKTLASLTALSKNSHGEMVPSEVHLATDPYVDGHPIEAFLYKDASECPICFLYYPPYLNKTRCCDQPICSECFVQIKRSEPHVPEHGEPNQVEPSAPAATEAERQNTLISEPAGCPFCVQPNFGITYEPPPFRRGLTYSNEHRAHLLARGTSGMSSSSSLSSTIGPLPSPTTAAATRRRTTSLSASDASVITTDQIRPDWAQKLANARAHAARRSAAATALHTAAYLMGNGGEGRAFGGFGRRHRREGGSGLLNPGSMSALAAMVEGHSGPGGPIEVENSGGNLGDVQPPNRSGRRSRIEDLEDMMMMEAIRLSLASEEDRRRKEEKDAKKDAKKREKENKKAEKAARRSMYGFNNESASTVDDGSNSRRPSIPGDNSTPGKGKDVDRPGNRNNTASSSTPQARRSMDSLSPEELPQRQRTHLQPSDALSIVPPSGGDGYKPSHLRQVSNNSSSASSLVESGPGSISNVVQGSGSSFDGSPDSSRLNVGNDNSGHSGGSAGQTPSEPLFNFQSLAAMIGEEDVWESEHGELQQGRNDSNRQDHESGHRANSDRLKRNENGQEVTEVAPDLSVP
ncbi:MAG: SNF1-interacting protein [Caeruleum heppii]|nr:MAG: SNF1-interacting protein [Caeruleum heppii]